VSLRSRRIGGGTHRQLWFVTQLPGLLLKRRSCLDRRLTLLGFFRVLARSVASIQAPGSLKGACEEMVSRPDALNPLTRPCTSGYLLLRYPLGVAANSVEGWLVLSDRMRCGSLRGCVHASMDDRGLARNRPTRHRVTYQSALYSRRAVLCSQEGATRLTGGTPRRG